MEERRRLLQQAVKAIEEAIKIHRRLNLPADLAGSLNNASNCYSDVAQVAEDVEERRRLLQQALEAIEEARELYRRLNLPANLASSLNNASNRYSDLAQAAEDVEERHRLLQQAVKAVEEAIKIRRRLNLPADLAVSLNNASGCYSAQAELEQEETEKHALQVRACQSIDEAIRLFEQVGQTYWLVQAYPDGVRTHLPLMSERPGSLERVKEYAAKAAKLLKAYGEEEEAAYYEELARRLRDEAAD